MLRIKYVFHGSGFGGPLVGSAQDLGNRSHDGREPDTARKEGRRGLFVAAEATQDMVTRLTGLVVDKKAVTEIRVTSILKLDRSSKQNATQGRPDA